LPKSCEGRRKVELHRNLIGTLCAYINVRNFGRKKDLTDLAEIFWKFSLMFLIKKTRRG